MISGKEVTIEERNVIGENNYTVAKCINLSNDKLHKLAAKLLDSDYVVGVDNFSVIAKNKSVGKVVGGKLNCSREVNANLINDKLDNNFGISVGKVFDRKLNCSRYANSINDKLDNNLSISVFNRKFDGNRELKETELETKRGLRINNNNTPNSRLTLINNVKPLTSTLSSSPCLKPLHVSNSTFHLNHCHHGNIIIKHCESRKRK